jgi:hypothetical protein
MNNQSNLSHIRSTLAGSIIPASNIVFTSLTGAGSFSDGTPYNENVCDTCHNTTTHHQSDGTAPSGQNHEDSSDCTTCHAHADAYLPNPALLVVSSPHDTVTDCNFCHTGPNYADSVLNSACNQCHTAGGALKGSYPTAQDVATHRSENCIECHDPMNDQTNLVHVRSTITGSIIPATITFTSYTGAGSFADGAPYEENICDTCHSTANHHQADGVAPGGQSHNDSADCRTCHAHIDGFSQTGTVADTPHDAVSDCNYCHDGVDYANPIPNSQCEQCHTAGGALKGSYPTAQDVLPHSGTTYGAFTIDCVECHDPMNAQTNLMHVRSTISGSIVPATITFTSWTGAGSYTDGAPYTENICETCHTLTNHHQSDGTAPGGQHHNDGEDCASCHPHINAFQTNVTPPPAPHQAVDCSTCHDAGTYFMGAPIDNAKCQSCHAPASPGTTIEYDWGSCRTESGSTNIPDGDVSADVILTTVISDTSKAFLLVDYTAQATTEQGRDHMVSGYIANANTLTFERLGAAGIPVGQAEISYSVVECMNNEFSVQRGEVSLGIGVESNTATINTVDTTKSIVIVGAHTDIAAAEHYQAYVTGELQDATTVEIRRSAASTDANTHVRYEVVEFGAVTGVNVYTGEVLLNGGQSVVDTLGTPVTNMSTSWLYFSYDATDDGPQQTALTGQLTATDQVTFARHAANAYNNRIRYYVVEFPLGEVNVQRGSSSYLGGGSATVTHDIPITAVSALDKAFSFVTHTVADTGSTLGPPFNQMDDFAGLSDGTRPTFGNWTGVNGSDSTLGWVALSGSTGSASTGPGAGNSDPYVYLESSASSQTYGVGVTAGSTQYLESNIIDASALSSLTFAFDWNMNVNGNSDATLHLDAWNGTTWDLDITGAALNTGNNGDVWVPVSPLNLIGYTNTDFQLRFRYIVGTAGNVYHNDVAVDNLEFVGTSGAISILARVHWTEILTTTSNIQLSNWRGDTADADANFEWQAIEFVGTGAVVGAGSDIKRETHFSSTYTDPTTSQLLDVACVECHNPMRPQTNMHFVRDTIRSSSVVFTSHTGTNSFADGDATYDGICEVCHTQTSHHQNDGSAPQQSHNDGIDCSGCHPHLDGFNPNITPPPAPHDAVTCSVCHVTQDTYLLNSAIPSSTCLTCHDQAAPNALGGGADTKVMRHYGNSYNDPTTGSLLDVECIECHNPMRPQTNLMHIRDTIRGNDIVFTSFAGPDSYADGAPYLANICDSCHTQTLHHQNDGTAPGGQTHNNSADCVACHPHAEGFNINITPAGPPHDRVDCTTCHDPGTYYKGADIPASKCMFCHDQSAPNKTVDYDWSACRTEAGTTSVNDGNNLSVVTLTTAVTDLSKAFLLVDSAGPTSVEQGQDHMVSGFINDETTLRFQREGTVGQAEVSYAVVECMYNEFYVQRGEMTLTSGMATTSGSILPVDPSRSIVIVNSRTTTSAVEQYQAHVTGELLDGNTVQTSRAASATDSITNVRFAVIEFPAVSNVIVHTGEVTFNGGQSITDTLGAPVNDMNSTWLYFSHDATDDGPQQTSINGQLTAVDQVTFNRHAANAYNNRIRYYVVEFPTGEVTVQRGSSTYLGGIPATVTHDIPVTAVSATDKAFTFVTNTTASTGGIGGGGTFEEFEYFDTADVNNDWSNWVDSLSSPGTNGYLMTRMTSTGTGQCSGGAGTSYTPSNNTGPCFLHSGTGFLVLENSGSAPYPDRTFTRTLAFDADTYPANISFASAVNTNVGEGAVLRFEVNDGGGWTTEWQQVDYDGNAGAWTDVDINLFDGTVSINAGASEPTSNYGGSDTAYTAGSLQFRFVFVSGSSWGNDIAIDTVRVYGTSAPVTAYPNNLWTELMTTTSNIQMSSWKADTSDSDANFEWQLIEFTGSGEVFTGSDAKVDIHFSNFYTDPTTGDFVDIQCSECHNPMRPQTNLAYVRDTIRGMSVVFTAYTGANSFADGDAVYDGICEVCHTQNNHHQNDGTAPGGQSHNDGTDCRACHSHLGGFRNDDLPPAPHDAFPCTVCHLTPDSYVFDADIPNSACLITCHDQSAPGATAEGGADKKADRHYGSTYNDPTTGQPVDINCVECHNPMRAQTNLEFIKDTLRGNAVVFTAFTGTNSFADGGAPYDGVCEVCHTQTDHHRNDGLAPNQVHNDGIDCRGCHAHIDGFNQNVVPPPAPHTALLCTDCHVTPDTYILDAPIPKSVCLACHDGASAMLVGGHFSTYYTDPTTGSLADIECLECHNPMRPQTNLGLIRDTIRGNTVTFTALTGAGSFADGAPHTGNICETCHTQTDHHQADGSAPGGQSHNDGVDCTGCHAHVDGFRMTDQPPSPHAGQPCSVCHDAGTYVFDADIANSKCQSCHDLAAPVAASNGADIKVEGHFGSTYTDPTTSLPLDVKCVECHNPMRAQANLSFIRSMIRTNTVVFTATTGANSFADGDATYDGICEVCHTQTDHHQNDGSAPNQSHNDGADCTGCHTHLDGFQTFLTPPPPHDLITDCTECHIAAPDYVSPVPNAQCMACHDTAAPGAIAADWSSCRTESGTASIADLSSSVDVTLTTDITDVNQAFMLMDISGPEAVTQGRDHMVSGDILDVSTLTFQRGGSTGQVEIS